MDRLPSLKACPKCGLKNRPDSIRCDFCGWGLINDAQEHAKKADDGPSNIEEQYNVPLEGKTVPEQDIPIPDAPDVPLVKKEADIPEPPPVMIGPVPVESSNVPLPPNETPSGTSTDNKENEDRTATTLPLGYLSAPVPSQEVGDTATSDMMAEPLYSSSEDVIDSQEVDKSQEEQNDLDHPGTNTRHAE